MGTIGEDLLACVIVILYTTRDKHNQFKET